MEHALAANDDFEKIEEDADSIQLIKLIDRAYYNYQPHEFAPLGAWDTLDKLGKQIQPENISETQHYVSIKTTIEVCKANRVNFSLLCTHTVDMAM